MYLFSLFDLFELLNLFDLLNLLDLFSLFYTAVLPLGFCFFTHALYILSFKLKMVNRKSANSVNYLQIYNINALSEGGITHLCGPYGKADIQDAGLVIAHLEDHVVHAGNLVIQP